MNETLCTIKQYYVKLNVNNVVKLIQLNSFYLWNLNLFQVPE